MYTSQEEKVVHFNRLKPVSGVNVSPCSDNNLSTTAPVPTVNSKDDYDADEFELAALPVVEDHSPQTQQPLRHSTRTRRPPMMSRSPSDLDDKCEDTLPL